MYAEHLRFKRHLRPQVVPGEATYLMSEHGTAVLHGELIQLITPLLDGTRTTDEVLDAVDGRTELHHVRYLIERLVRQGHVCRTDPEAEPGGAAYWDMAGMDSDRAARALRSTPVRIIAAGSADAPGIADEIAAVLEDHGMNVRNDGTQSADRLTIVLCDDYLHPQLAGIDDEHRALGQPWMLAKPGGSVVWVGPIFRPGHTACWRCLAYRLLRHRTAQTYLQTRLGLSGPIPLPRTDLVGTRQLSARLIALDAIKWTAGYRDQAQSGVYTFDTLSFEGRRHDLQARPQCPGCGDPSLVSRQARRPIALIPRRKRHLGGAGHRALHADELLRRYGHLISPVTGIVREIRRHERDPGFFMSYVAGHNVALGARSLAQLRAGLRKQSSGKGMTSTEAKASALAEAVERHSGLFHGEEARVRATYGQLDGDVVHPNACQLYSERQFRDRAQWNASSSPSQYVCDPFDEGANADWTPVWSITHRRHRYLLTSYLYFDVPSEPGLVFARADSNGNAAGSCREDAIVQGFMELVERDSVALWWYNRVPRPGVDLASFAEPWIEELREVYARLHREVWAIDITADFDFPAVAAVSRRIDKPAEDIMFGFGAHFDPKVAVLRALTELNQLMPTVVDARPDGTGYGCDDKELLSWCAARVADHPYLLPDPAQPARTRASYRDRSSDDLCEDIMTIERAVRGRGMELLVLDQTRPDIGMTVVKVVVPGMRHFWARFGPGRLYDVPVQLGWLSAPTPEPELNPVPMFL